MEGYEQVNIIPVLVGGCLSVRQQHMTNIFTAISDLPPEQRAIRDKCFHPTGRFVEFKREEIEQSIPDRFEQMVRKYPDRIAVKTQHHTLTYGELNKAANRVAHLILMQRGRGEEPIALLLEKGAPLISTIFGILKAGKIYIPLDPSDPLARLRYILEDSRAIAVVTDCENVRLAEELSHNPVPVINIDDIDSTRSTENLGLCISSDAFAYVFYTSGSTGRSKGVVDTHRNVLHNVMRYTNSLHICAADRLTLLQSCSFSGSVSSLFSALLTGAAVFPFDLRKEGVGNLGTRLVQEEITIYHSVPSIFRHVATGSERFPKLRLIRLEGDQISQKDVEIFKKYFASDCILVNGLGATECGLVRQYFIDKQITVNRRVVPIGHAVEDMEIVLLDDSGKEVGAGRIGECAVRSRYLAIGYWQKPDLTRAAFAAVPDRSDLRIYRTGDLGRIHTDNCLEYLGRKNFQMKIQGQRVDVAEVEAALLELSMIKEATIQTRNDSSSEPRLIAYVVPDQKPTPTVSMLRRHLKEKLPSAMIPSAFVMLDRLPLTPDGKLDRHALPAPNWRRPELDSAYVAPRTPTEKVLGEIWAEVLGLDQVGCQDNFFELGGHSLHATQLISRIRTTFQVELPMDRLFEEPTVAGLALAVTQFQVMQLEHGEINRIFQEVEAFSEGSGTKSK